MYREPARWGVWETRADLLHVEYADTVVALGAAPMLLPAAGADPDEMAQLAATVVRRLDALIICGGADVDPSRYSADPHPTTDPPRRDRDAWELALLTAAADVDLPVLGICRGMQMMAVAAGGELEQHLPDRVGHTRHSPGGPEFGSIPVDVSAGSRLQALVGDQVRVNCHHHQSIRSAPGYQVVASADDGTIEAMEAAGDRFCLAVQWHPETTADLGLIAGLIDAARLRQSAGA